MARTIESINLIWRRPGCRGGRPTIIGRGLKVKHIVVDHLCGEDNLTPEEIAERYKATPAQVYAVLAYYFQHKSEIDADIAADIRFSEILESAGPEAAMDSLPLPKELDEAILEGVPLISRDTDLHHGSACVDGTRLRVADVVVEWRYGVSEPADIADKFDLSLGQVYGAMAYYHERRNEIDAEIEYESRVDKRWKADGLVPK